jgi:hypothetical protein
MAATTADYSDLWLFDVGYNTESRITFHVRLLLFDFEYLSAPVGATG